MMTLAEGIRHAEECAERCEKLEGRRNQLCAEEHRQLAEWLKELQSIVHCGECIYYSDGDCKSGILPFSEYSDTRNVWLMPTDFCSYGERSE